MIKKVSLPKLPKGFKHLEVDGIVQYRVPEEGEYYWDAIPSEMPDRATSACNLEYNHWILVSIPQPKPVRLVDRIREKYKEFEVVPLTFSNGKSPDLRTRLVFIEKRKVKSHIEAQSYVNFFRYVYQMESGDIIAELDTLIYRPDKMPLRPVAILFSK